MLSQEKISPKWDCDCVVRMLAYLKVERFSRRYTLLLFTFTFCFFLFWLTLVFVAAQGLSLVAMRQGYLLLWCSGFSLRWLLLLQRTGSRHAGFMSFGAWTQQLWHRGLAALWHVWSSQTRDRTHVPCIDRQILNHWTTREVLIFKLILLTTWSVIQLLG